MKLTSIHRNYVAAKHAANCNALMTSYPFHTAGNDRKTWQNEFPRIAYIIDHMTKGTIQQNIK